VLTNARRSRRARSTSVMFVAKASEEQSLCINISETSTKMSWKTSLTRAFSRDRLEMPTLKMPAS